MDEIFSLLPPRRNQHAFRDRSGPDRAAELTYAMARKQKHSDQRFLQTARQLKFLAASVFLLHGTQMEDNLVVQEAREALRDL